MEKSEWTEEEEEQEEEDFKECVEESNGSLTPVLDDSLDFNELEKQKVAIMRAFVEKEDSSAKVTYSSSIRCDSVVFIACLFSYNVQIRGVVFLLKFGYYYWKDLEDCFSRDTFHHIFHSLLEFDLFCFLVTLRPSC